jgi:hypothetical protein
MTFAAPPPPPRITRTMRDRIDPIASSRWLRR